MDSSSGGLVVAPPVLGTTTLAAADFARLASRTRRLPPLLGEQKLWERFVSRAARAQENLVPPREFAGGGCG